MKTKIFLLFVLTTKLIFTQDNSWYSFPNGFPETDIRYIHIDSKNDKYVGGYAYGLHKYSKGNWTGYSGVSNSDVRQSYHDTLGNLWAATWNKLSVLNATTNKWSSINVTKETYDILKSVIVDKANRVWVGTDGGADSTDGLYMYHENKWKFYSPSNSALKGRCVWELKKDNNGVVWGCAGGLFRLNDTTIESFPISKNDIPLGNPVCLDFDQQNNVWVGVSTGALAKFDGQNWTVWNTQNSGIPIGQIYSIAVDKNNVVWLGTSKDGLIRFDGQNWTVFNATNSPIAGNFINTLAVDQDNNLWIGTSGKGVLVYNEDGISGVSGNVYNDLNKNGVKDAAEKGVPNQKIELSNGLDYAFTDSLGNYTCLIPSSGSYTATLICNNKYIDTIIPKSIGFNLNSGTERLANKNFGIQLTDSIVDVSIEHNLITEARPGFGLTVDLLVSNSGSTKLDSIQATFIYDTKLIFDSSDVHNLIFKNDSIFWNVDSISVFESKKVKLYFHLPPNVELLGQKLYLKSMVTLKNNEKDSLDNYFESDHTIIGSYDPNDKQVNPKGDTEFGYIPSSQNEFEYTIRFQNTGTASAINVLIKDTISTNLDMSTFRFITSSHPCVTDFKSGRTVFFDFKNIMLPDSTSNEAGSHGFIKYKINKVSDLTQGTEIKNKAYIFFDFNPPIITNETVNTIKDDVANLSVLESSGIIIHPNPFGSIVNISVNSNLEKSGTIFIYNSLGEQIVKKDIQATAKFDLSEIPSGVYLLKFVSENMNLNSRIIKL